MVKKFKDSGTLIKSTKKGQLSKSDKKLITRSPENADAVQDSGSEKVTLAMLSRVESFSFVYSQNLKG